MASFIAYSCSKDKFGDTPSLTLKSVNANVLPYDTVSSLVTFTFELTEKKYNPGDSLHLIIVVPNCNSDSATYVYPMTSLATGIPSTNAGNGFKGEIQASFSNGTFWEQYGYPDIESSSTCHLGPAIENDTATFKFVLGSGTHFSDTVVAGPIVLIHG
jgi:hypothetical protein